MHLIPSLAAGNIRVFCRVRPRTQEDLAQPSSELVVSYDPDDDGVVRIFHKGQRQSFDMDKVFRENSSQVEVDVTKILDNELFWVSLDGLLR